MLTDQQLHQVKSIIDNSTLDTLALKDDLLDHFCCLIEEYMQKGFSFELAYQQAYQMICPNGLDEIRQEATCLRQAGIALRMKKMLYLTGLFSAMAFSVGVACLLLHLPGKNQFLMGGLFGFSFLFVPMLGFHHYKAAFHLSVLERGKLALGSVSVFLFATATSFKLLHLQFAESLLLLSIGLFTFGFLPFLFFSLYKKEVA